MPTAARVADPEGSAGQPASTGDLQVIAAPWLKKGFVVEALFPAQLQLLRRKRIDPFFLIAWLLFCGVGVFVYLVYYLLKTDERVVLTSDAGGAIATRHEVGGINTLGAVAGTVLWFVAMLAIVSIAVGAGGGLLHGERTRGQAAEGSSPGESATASRETDEQFGQEDDVEPAHAEAVQAGRDPAGGGASARDVTDEVIADVSASSYKVSRSAEPERYSPEKAFDGRADTAWNEGAEGSGVGEWIEARFGRPVRVAYVTVTPGWNWVNPRGDLFTANRYMTAFDLEFDGGRRSFQVPEGTRVFRADLGGVQMSRVRIVARGVQQEVPRWDDLCVAEIRVFEGTPGAGVDNENHGAEALIAEDVGHPLLIVRPSATGLDPIREGFLGIDGSGRVVSLSNHDPPRGLPACSPGLVPCVADDGTTVRFRLGAACTGPEGGGMWWDSAMQQDPRCRSPMSICGAPGLSHDPDGQLVGDDEGCPVGDDETRTLRNAGDPCRGPSPGYTWQCSADSSTLICTSPTR